MTILKKVKVALGIVTGKVLTGPIEVSVDLTRKCTTECVMCWYWSPLLGHKPSQEWAGQQLDFELLQKLIRELGALKVKRIILGGQGDPFLYPGIMEAIEAIKLNGVEASLITSGYYFSDEKIKKLAELKIDHMDVSLQAATPETYKKIHPSLQEGTFERIRSSLLLLTELKKKSGSSSPTITLIDAICNLNYQDTVKMVELAREIGAQSIGFKRVDVIPETKELLLNQRQLTELKGFLGEAGKMAQGWGIRTSIDFYDKYVSDGLVTGEYTSKYYAVMPCYVGWLSSRVLSDGSVIPCCGCYNTSFGNIRDNSFRDIWFSKGYREFREASINISKNPGLVKGCKCSSCIDLENNLGIFRKLHPFKARSARDTRHE